MAIAQFPENAALKVFYAMTQYNLNNYSVAMELLLKELAQTSSDEKIKTYSKAITFYSDKLNRLFE